MIVSSSSTPPPSISASASSSSSLPFLPIFYIIIFPPSLPLSKDLKEEVINEGAMWPFKGG
jgi:hypothetical protein